MIQSTLLFPSAMPSGQMPLLLYGQTDSGRYAKIWIESKTYDLVITWTTYDTGGSVYSHGTNLTIHGLQGCDLDTGLETSPTNATCDFRWAAVSLEPQHGARFAAIDMRWLTAVHLPQSWKYLSVWPAFGYFNTAVFPWICHAQHGWMFAYGESLVYMCFWTPDMGWLYSDLYVYPYLYRFSDNTWLWYVLDSANPRLFYNVSTSSWEAR
jgi:hypothetical protein